MQHGGGHDLVTGCQRSGHHDVWLQAQQGNNRLADHRDILGHQDPDRRPPPSLLP
jgi:hypothetical protein